MMCRHDDRKVGLMFWELLPSVNDTLEQWDVGICNAKPDPPAGDLVSVLPHILSLNCSYSFFHKPVNLMTTKIDSELQSTTPTESARYRISVMPR